MPTDSRPSGADHWFRPGDTTAVTFTWPAGLLTGRTFTAALDAQALTVVVVGDVMTVSATTTQTSTAGVGRHDFTLTETTAGGSNEVFAGNWVGSLGVNATATTSYTVTLPSGSVTVSVSGQAELTAHAAGTGFGRHVPSGGTEGQVLLATNGAATWTRPRIEALEDQAGKNRWRQKLSLSRSGGLAALSAIILIIADSRGRGNATLYRGAWPDRLRSRFLGATPGSYGLLPASGSLGGVTDGDWPGGDNPWTFTGAVTGNVVYGLGFHSANIPAAGTATITYFGDKIAFYYVRTTDGPTACAVSLDGAAQSPVNARGSVLPGQQAQFGTHGNYGFHTLTITPNDGPLVLEAAQWFDGDAPFFVSGSVQTFDASHAGFSTGNWAGANNDWSAMLTGADAFFGCGIIVLDVNDISFAGISATQHRDNIVTIVQRVDARLGSSSLSWLLVCLPCNTVDTLPYVEAKRQAAATLGTSRVSVVDLAALRPGRAWGTDLSADAVHPNDAGHIWVADQLGGILDPTPATTSPTQPKRFVIDASTPVDGAVSWTAAWTALTGGVGGYDQSGGGTTVGEHWYRVWLDAGTTRFTITMQEDTGLGTVEVLAGRWVGNTPTLTSCGTKANAAGTPTLVTTRLGTSITTALAGWHPVCVRKTSASGAIRFVQLVADKTA